MTAVGIRELRQRASELLRRVAAGETLTVTDRGRPVALLTPIPAPTGLARLRDQGLTQRASRRLAELPEPLTLPGELSASEVLQQLRENER